MIASEIIQVDIPNKNIIKYMCPYNVNIARIHEIYRIISIVGDLPRAEMEYQKLVDLNQSYLNCTHCRKCELIHQKEHHNINFLEAIHQFLYNGK